jgi:hypothetical protein
LLHSARDLFRFSMKPGGRAATLALLALAAAIAVACSNNSSTTPSVTPTPSTSPTATGPTPTPTAPAQYFVSIEYNASPTPDPTYGNVDGYGLMAGLPTASPVPTSAPEGIITVNANSTIVFLNFDKVTRSVSLLGPANGMNWPSTFTNTCGLSCPVPPAGTSITSVEFSAWITAASGTPNYSLVYSTGAVPGMYYFGDATNYLSVPSLRTVIIVQ